MNDSFPDASVVSTDRRQFLSGGLFAVLSSLLRQQSAGAAAPRVSARLPIRSCILLIYYGGPSHLDTWDLKPQAPSDVRGEFQPIATSVPGRFVGEHLRRTARIIDKLAVIRSMHHPMTNHNAAMYEALVGRTPLGGDNEILGSDRKNDFPCYGSALSYLTEQGRLDTLNAPLAHVALPHVMHNVVPLPGQNAGFLDPRFDPMQIVRDPNRPDFQVEELSLPADLPVLRLERRQDLLRALNATPFPPGTDGMTSYRQRALALFRDPRLRQACEIGQEPATARDRYGRHTLGQSLLLARRFVEAGVRLINVNDKIYNGQLANWDCHESCFPRHRDVLLPPADQAFSALVEDLSARGLLETTLVVAMGEFGRTPRINGNAGRDHWPHCYSVVVAGGGVAGGAAYGSSDQIGAYPDVLPVTPGDLAATIFWRFGVDPAQEIHDRFGRPYRLAAGEPIQSLFPAA